MQVFYQTLFIRQFKKLNPDLQNEVLEKIEIFKDNYKNPILKTHKLHGRLKDFYSFSINYSHRIVFEIQDNNKAIFLEIGSHDLYK